MLATLLSAAALACGFILLYTTWQRAYGLRWLLFASIGWAYLYGFLWSNRSKNHRVGEERVLPTFGAGNALTICRGTLIALLLGFIASPRPAGWLGWLPGIFYTLAAIMDLFDGYLARITDHATRLGDMLDLKLDALGVLIAALLAVRYGQVPAWYMLVGLARYLFIAGIWLRERLGKPVHELSESAWRRPFAGAQMGFLAVILWPVFSPPGTHLAAMLFGAPFLAGFAWDWLAVSGAINPAKNGYGPERDAIATRADAWLAKILSIWLPLILRVSLLAMVTVVLVRRLPGYVQQLTPGSGLSAISANWVIILILFLLVNGTMLLAVGAAGRTAALATMFSIGLHQHISAPNTWDFLIIITAGALFFLGTGTYSLWRPEDQLIRKRLGES